MRLYALPIRAAMKAVESAMDHNTISDRALALSGCAPLKAMKSDASRLIASIEEIYFSH